MRERGTKAEALSAQAAVWLPGLMGFTIVWRTAAYYRDTDPLAFWLVAVMGAGLLAGLLELAARARGAVALAREVRGLPPAPDDDTIDQASPALRAYLRARVEHAPAPAQPAVLTPYLIGLLVMLGLLGTFMGLFETLRGAGQALTASEDISALRAGLADPMSGLTRSFGSSAAGVCTSAMLGLAAVLVRRTEGRAARAIQAYCTGPLRRLSPLRRQLAALETLAAHGQAWPRAAESLSAAIQRLDTLAGRWEEAHALGAARIHDALLKSAHQLGQQLQTAARDAARGTRDAVAPLIEDMTRQVAEASASRVQALSAALEADRSARREEDERARRALLAQAGELGEAARQQLDSLQRASEALAERTVGSAERLEQLLGEVHRAHEQAEREHAAALGQLSAQLEASAQARERALTERWEQLAAALQARQQADEAREQARSAEFQQGVEALAGHLTRTAEEIAAQLRARAAQDAASAQGAAQALAQLRDAAAQLADQAARLDEVERAMSAAHRQSVVDVSEQLTGHLERLSEADLALRESHGRAADALREAVAEQAERFAAAEANLHQVHQAAAERLAGQLAEHAERLGDSLGASDKLIQEAAATLKASSVEMGAVAELFASAVDRQREAAQRWLEDLSGLEDAVERAGREAAADALGEQLASTQEVFARQLQFQRELFEQLRSWRAPAAPYEGPEPDAAHHREGSHGDVTA